MVPRGQLLVGLPFYAIEFNAPDLYQPDWKDHEPEDCWGCGDVTEVGLHLRKGEVDAYLYDLTLPTNR